MCRLRLRGLFPPGMAGHPCLTLRAKSLSLRGDPAKPVVPGGSESGDRFGIPNPRESGSVIGADRRRSGPSCVLPQGLPQGQTESGGIVLAAICWAASTQRRCHPQEALYLPTFSHLLIVNKLLSLSLSLSLRLSGTQMRRKETEYRQHKSAIRWPNICYM